MSNDKGIGAPKGGRVHFFPLELSKRIREMYHVVYFYDKHNYLLIRKRQKHFDLYLIMQTSSHCYRVMYFDRLKEVCEYKSFKSYIDVIDYITFKVVGRIENEKAIYKKASK